ncbi:uncharacterized protein EAF01_005746 [Botrytis porri]|uniref:FAD-binding domain-containing protein n=1 Tax=Botrytis porri TaxID=87229 RepID=A0A4Z1K980_9HELO|nr:uncharacterized protein EAF01_005746 [Botrytis porri]KAF7905225.1 hypothetical protein EAF01_005746 [Botrytis porri]TGO82547.1 hypothetical protein BPOR_0808g00030 [Botrytis porri]
MLPRISIIGAGPSGLVLASLFHRNKIPFTIYDLRSRPSPDLVNVPSGSLDLHVESGQRALAACGLLQAFRSLTAECSEEHIICDRFGDIKFEAPNHNEERPEISRNSLIELLVSSLPGNVIQWEHRIQSVSPNPSNPQQQTIIFQNGSSHACDLVIGADGAWSKVRPLLTDVKPYFSGVHWMMLTIPNITKRFPEIAKMVGTGTFWALGGKRFILSQRGSMDSARVYVGIQNEDINYCNEAGLNSLDLEQLKEKTLGEYGTFANFGRGVRELLERGLDEEKIPQFVQLCMLPTGHTWEHKANATLVGDAAHLMTPFAGEGVNSAMLDALELAQGIISAGKKETSISDAVKEYEMKMFVRAKENAEDTWTNLEKISEDNAPKAIVEWFNSFSAPPEQV